MYIPSDIQICQCINGGHECFFLEKVESYLFRQHNVLRYKDKVWSPRKPNMSPWCHCTSTFSKNMCLIVIDSTLVLKNNFMKQSSSSINFLQDGGVSTQALLLHIHYYLHTICRYYTFLCTQIKCQQSCFIAGQCFKGRRVDKTINNHCTGSNIIP